VASQNGLTNDGVDVDVNEVVVPAAFERHLKRKRSENEEIVGSPNPKKSKHDEVAPVQAPSPLPIPATTSTEAANLKRDRERTTVLVSNLPEIATQDEVQKLFKDCGEIREIILKKLPNELVATVEFMERESIPAALTKDKKRVLGAEIAVNIGWQSTLFVTNFQEGMDDVKMRALFEKVGVLARKLRCDHIDIVNSMGLSWMSAGLRRG
jgi:RNA recognition motif-containing protein